MKFSDRAGRLEASPIREMMNRAAELPDVISFAVGQPDFRPAPQVLRAAEEALERGETGYAPGGGIPELREAYAAYLSEVDGVPYTADEVMVTVGGMAALYLTLTCVLQPGDEVLLPSPYWSNYAQQVELCGGVPVPVEVRESDGFSVRPEALRAAVTPRTRVILLNFPCNPTGALLERGALEEIADLARAHDLLVLSDEVYRHLRYDRRPFVSIASLPGMKERTVVVDSCSKSFAMPGLRVGFAAAPRELLSLMLRVTEDVYSCVATPCQYAALEALRSGKEHLEAMVAEYRRRRDYICARFNAIPGLSCAVPRGAFYLFGNISGTGLTAREFCDRLLEEQHVAVVPGDLFGARSGGYVRISFAVSMEEIERGMDRIEAFAARLRKGETP